MDLYRTVSSLAGLPAPDDVDGRDISPLVADPQRPWAGDAISTYGEGNHMLRTPQWRYIRYRDGGTELYSMVADPWELVNLAEKPAFATEKQELDHALDEALNQNPVTNRK